MKPMPYTALDLLVELEADYAPACMRENDSVTTHHRYAGKVELIQDLRRRLEWSENEATAHQILAKL